MCRLLILQNDFFRILALEKLGTVFNQVSTNLQYTPRRFAIHLDSGNIVVLETDHNTYTESTKEERKQQMAQVARCVKALVCRREVVGSMLRGSCVPVSLKKTFSSFLAMEVPGIISAWI